MHELALTDDLVMGAVRAAREAGARAIRQITLELASTSHADPDAVTAHFEMISRGTLAEGAELRFSYRPVSHECPHCGVSYIVTDEWACPDCGAPALLDHDEPEMTLGKMEIDIPMSA